MLSFKMFNNQFEVVNINIYDTIPDNISIILILYKLVFTHYYVIICNIFDFVKQDFKIFILSLVEEDFKNNRKRLVMNIIKLCNY